MAYDPTFSRGSGWNEPWCTSCKNPIAEGQRSVKVSFNHDPLGHKGLTGVYHEQCGRVFQSLARVVNMDWFGRF